MNTCMEFCEILLIGAIMVAVVNVLLGAGCLARIDRMSEKLAEDRAQA
ncbi:MAG: hypothetical protein Q4F72_10035 [Desulfovibrionaceae bacterium]|nr:hypothetical protein [Desulfovibrionaceae bacterium]